ncbi:MAG: hypothetical protein ABIJ36_01650 [Patescibacteria group bacterium]|nr:hypothetical protein [Patescibacteria group bacterium]
MKKIETIWHYILWSALEKGVFKHTQKELSKLFGYSLSTVNLALHVPTQIGAVKKTSKFFTVFDFKKFLYLYASCRNLQKDIIYQTNLSVPVMEIEGLVPSQSIYACYSAARHVFKEPPADYSKVYVYLEEEHLPKIFKRFGKNNDKNPNFFILKMHGTMKKYGNITTVPQTFADIWNLSDWYSRDFILALEEKIDGILS